MCGLYFHLLVLMFISNGNKQKTKDAENNDNES